MQRGPLLQLAQERFAGRPWHTLIADEAQAIKNAAAKRSQAVFEDLLYQNMRQAGGQETQQNVLPTGLQLGTGVRPVATARLFTQGNLQKTDNPFDMAVNGNGFFSVQLPDGGVAYTRDGSFQVSAQGQLVTNNGYLLQPGITIPATAQSVTIGTDGTVSVTLPGQAQPQSVGQIQLASFVNPAGLEPKGQNLYAETAASGAPALSLIHISEPTRPY